MKRRGEITIFFSIILLCVFGLICVMLESARTAGARCYLQMAANSSIDSLFSQYHRELWNQYHLFGLEYESETETAKRFQGYLNQYLAVNNWYPMETEAVQIEDMKRLTDDGGIYLEQEILAYMKYGVWSQLNIMPDQGEQLWNDIKEGRVVQELSSSYKDQSREVWKLEAALENIYVCLAKQKDYHSQAEKQLAGEDNLGFFRQSDKLEQEIGKIKKLVAVYEKQADDMRDKLRKLEEQYLEKEVELGVDMQRVLREELENYGTYIREDGSRRQEIVFLILLGEENQGVIAETKETVRQVERYLEEQAEAEDSQEDNLDESDDVRELWLDARRKWNQFGHSSMSAPGIRDEEKRGWLEQIERLTKISLLELVVPEGADISSAVLYLSDAPSGVRERNGETDKKNLLNRVLVNEYCAMHYSNFVTGQGEEGRALYEMEYLLSGKITDRDNLEQTVKNLLTLREGLNLIHILMDNQKREEARALALVITGAVGLVPLVEITAMFIMGIWALGESAVDVRALLAGKHVPLFKTKADWNLGLEQLLEMGQEKRYPESQHNEGGFSYVEYLKLLLLAEISEKKYYRMMDVIQMNLRRKQESYRIESCAYRVDMLAMVCGKHVFFAVPFVEKLTGSKEHRYQMRVQTQKAY